MGIRRITSTSTMTWTPDMAGPPSSTLAVDYSQSAGLPDLGVDGDMLEVDDGSKPEVVEKPKWDHSRLWHVFMDFDKTITVEDTIEPLVVQSILYNHEEIINGGGEVLDLKDVALTSQYKEWEECKRRYLHDFQTWENGVKLNSEFMRQLSLGEHVNDKNGRILGADPGFNPKFKTPFASKHGSGLPAVARTWQLRYEHTIMDEIEHLESEAGVEKESLNRVNETGIFDHVGRDHALRDRAMLSRRRLTPDEIARDGKYPQYGVKIRSGFKEFIEDLQSRPNAVWGIVSVNWSKDWIQGIISRELGSNRPLDFPIMSNNPVPPDETERYGNGTRKDHGIAGVLPPLEPLPISPPPAYPTPLDVGVSNSAHKRNERKNHKDIGYDHKLGPSHQLTPPTQHLPIPSLILTANDKLKALERLLQAYTNNPERRGVKALSMYIGDSLTDIACLLRADVGILMCPELPEEMPRPPRSRKGKEAAPLISGHEAGPSSSPHFSLPGDTLRQLEPEDNKVVSMLQQCGFAVRHVRDHAMLFRRVPALPGDGGEDAPFVRLLWCRDFDEILEGGLLNDANWTPATTVKQMIPSLTSRNRVCKDSL